MLRRRILASAMASVMAIGSVAVVASAEETAAATTQVKTKADLEAYVKSFDSFRSKEINDYGSISGERFLDALEYAENVIDAGDSTPDDYTVAYKMIETTYKKLKVYTAEELSTLIKANKSKYESNNVMNPDINDTIYKNETGKTQWDNFVTAYENANTVVDSKDSRIISDAYESLEAAVENLTPMDTVTKAQFRAAVKEYESLKQNVYKYDTWRRGEISGDWGAFGSITDFWMYAGKKASFGAVMTVATASETSVYGQYNAFDALKTVNKTSDADINSAYKKLLDMNGLMKAWSPDDTSRASKATVQSLINKYRGVLVFNYNPQGAYDLLDAIAAKVGAANLTIGDGKKSMTDPWDYEITTAKVKDRSVAYENDVEIAKLTSASINVKIDSKNGKALYIPTKDGVYDPSVAILDENENKAGGNRVKGYTYKLLAKGSTFDLTDYVDVPETMLGTVADRTLKAGSDAATTSTALETAQYNIAEAVKAADAKAADVTKNNAECKAAVDKIGNADVTKVYADFMAAANKAFADAQTAVSDASKKIAAAKTAAEVEVAKASVTKALNALDAYKSDPNPDWQKAVNGKAWDTYNGDIHNALEAAKVDDSSWNSGVRPYDFGHAIYEYVDAMTKAFAAGDDTLTAAGRDDSEAAIYNAYVSLGDKNLVNKDFVNQDFNGIIDHDADDVLGGTPVGDKIVLNIGNPVKNLDVSLAVAYDMAKTYIRGDKDEVKEYQNIYTASTSGEIADKTAALSAPEWTVVYRYLKYALTDKYDLTDDKYTRAQVQDLLEKSYELAEKTGDAGLFTVNHTTLVARRKEASEWLAAAGKDAKYKDNQTRPLGKSSTDIYRDLKGAYDALEKDFNEFKYSFGEIYTAIATYAEMIDEGELEATDTLKAALDEAAYRLSIVKSLNGAVKTDLNAWEKSDDYIDDDAYTTDRFFNAYNRVFTNGSNDAYTLMTDTKVGQVILLKNSDTADGLAHKRLAEAYEALDAEVKKQTEVKTLLGDVNGDGVVNALDASAILKAAVNNTVIDVAVGDYNADGAVNALDASAILKFVVSQA